MKIYVRRRHIEKGQRVSSRGCPIALAARESTGDFDVAVLTTVIRIGRNASELPRNARRFIDRFDSGKPVKPFAFVLK